MNYEALTDIFLSWGLSMDGASIAVVLTQFAVMMTKVAVLMWVFVWVRWSFPRFRYDQLMRFGWQRLIPLSLISLALTTGVTYFRGSG